ncbi:hypothetical protein CAI16_10605 [Virgibacillus dokdonensis]|uniref:N-acetyltransferase domain-containing protein n=1 Tax=Virgibacillus dokdonensis TaxID=302167 RepID=A0A3E0WQL4_9BACI|nr:GNAT family N-acetyltransferase [Virgibacillus dokdonensis]RFA34699.1 hypothetical protein CAI16_10605 [Virgibacillus dokdonensis]
MGLSVRKANTTDIDDIKQILMEAARWIKRQGINQWEFLLTDNQDEEIKTNIEEGTMYVAEMNHRIVATFYLGSTQTEFDIKIWGEREDTACYLHRLAVHQDYRGKQIGKQVIDWIVSHLDKETVLRLDCVAENPGLNSFYQQYGFNFVGKEKEGEKEFSLYEKWI